MSRQHQKLLYKAIIDNYASYLQSKDIIPANMKAHAYWQWKAKDELKKLYCKATKSVRIEKPLEVYNQKLQETLKETMQKEYTLETKIDIIVKDNEYNLRDFIEDLAIELGATEYFSLALRCCSNEKAIAFTRYCIDYFLDKEIPMDEQLRNSIFEAEQEHYIYACLKSKVCAVTGSRENVQFCHWDSANSLGGYSQDFGQGTYISLTAEKHAEFHHLEAKEFKKKYHVTGIKLTPEQVKQLKKIYPNHFKGAK